MNSDINDQYLTITYDNFSRETQRILNDVKNEKDDDTCKFLHKKLNLLHNIELNLLKLKSLKVKPLKK